MPVKEKRLLLVIFFFVILPGAIAFVVKVASYFMVEVEQGMAGFALPFFNYLFIALGFFCLFIWSFMSGHFKDIDQPAIDVILNHERLESAARMPEEPDGT